MKPSGWIAWVLLLSGAALAFAQETPDKGAIELRSRVTRVIVYPQWAYVTREAEAAIPEGTSRFVFKSLPAWIDEESIRVKLGAANGVAIAGASAQKVFLSRASEDEVRRAEEEVLRLRDQVADLGAELNSLAEEKKYLDGLTPWKLGQSPKEAPARPVSVAELRELKSFIQQETLANLRRASQVERRIRAIKPELAAREKEWQSIQGRGRLEQRDIVVELEARSAMRTVLGVSYLISGASWYPSYDARADSETGRIAFAGKAVVQQSTGEDWNGVAFTVSTIQPYLVREKPAIAPWYVTARTAGEEIEGEVREAAFRAGASESQARRMKDIQQRQMELNREDAKAQSAFQAVSENFAQALKVARQIEERGATIEFTVPAAFTVKSDGKPVYLPIGQAELEATRRYSAAPAVSRSTYVTGMMRNNAPFVILPGPVKVYIDGNFMGKSEVDCIAQGEPFEIYLGLEERLQVSRELDMKKSSTRSAGDRKRLQVVYVIEVKNYLKTPATIEIRDQIPVSQDAAVKVKLVEISPATEAIDKGVITWPLTLQAGEAKQLRFEFQMEYPANVSLKNAVELERMLLK